jgi:hypothetical protein
MKTLQQEFTNMFEQEAAKLRELHASIMRGLRTCFEKAVRSGEILNKIRRKAKYGQWEPWLKANVPYSRVTANRYILAFKHQDEIRGKCIAGDTFQRWDRLLHNRSNVKRRKPRGSRVGTRAQNDSRANVERPVRNFASSNSGNGVNKPNQPNSDMKQKHSTGQGKAANWWSGYIDWPEADLHNVHELWSRLDGPGFRLFLNHWASKDKNWPVIKAEFLRFIKAEKKPAKQVTTRGKQQ